MYIYLITNKINGKRYVGQTIVFVSARWYSHKYSALKGKYEWPLHRAIRKYGKDNFEIKVLSRCISTKELDHRETYYIKILNTLSPNGYNAQTGGHSNHTVSEETKYKQSEATKGENNPRFGKKNSPEHRANISKSKRGRPGHSMSEEGKRKISKANTGKRPALGYRHTEDAKKQISKSKDEVKVSIFCVTNNTTYESISVASKTLGVDRCKIKDVIRGKRNHTKGFVFKKV